MTISLLNHVALDWLKALDLVDAVQTEFGNELKSGTQLASLVPRIAHQVETLRRRNSAAQVNYVADQPQFEPGIEDHVMYVGSSQHRGSTWRPGRAPGRGSRPYYNQQRGGRAGGPPTRGSFPARETGRSDYCPNCHYIGRELNLRVDFRHLPGDCPRKRAATNMVLGDGGLPDGHEQEHHDEALHHEHHLEQAVADIMLNDRPAEVRLSRIPNSSYDLDQSLSVSSPQACQESTLLSSFCGRSPTAQLHSGFPQTEIRTAQNFNNTVFPAVSTTSCSNPLTTTVVNNNGKSWLEEMSTKIRRLEVRLTQSNTEVRKAKSPTVETILFGTKIISTADEGSELNCMDHRIAVENNIPFTATRQTAAGAGSTSMTLMGETTSNISLQVPSGNNDIRWDLGKVIVVKNLGVPLLIGEPGKKDNSIITIPQTTILTRDITGNFVSLPYHASKGHQSGFSKHFLLSVPSNILLYPGECVSVPIPSTFANTVAAVTPHQEFHPDWPAPRITNVKNDSVVLQNDTRAPLFLPKGKPLADLRDTHIVLSLIHI